MGVLGLLLAVLAWRSVGDPDVGIHLAGGRWIAAHGGVPRLDPFTYTLADHAYVAYHWLFQLAVHFADRVAGATGLASLRFVALLATAALVADIFKVRRVSAAAAALVGLLAILGAEWRFTVRPELGSWLLGAAVLWILERRRAGLASPLFALPLLQWLWANVHISVVGLALIGIFAVAEAIRERRLVTPLVGWGAAAALATLANPYFLEGALYPLVLATRLSAENPFAQNIEELISPFAIAPDPRAPFSTSIGLSAFRALWLFGVAAVALHVARRRGVDVVLVIVFGALAALAVRNTTLYLVFAAPALAVALDDLWTRMVPDASRPAVSRLALGVTLAAALLCVPRIVSGTYYASQGRLDRFEARYSESGLALPGADWLASADLSGPGFNDLVLGSILVWRDPAHPVFIDGRNEVTGEAFYRDYQAAMDPERWSATQARWGFEYVALGHRASPRAQRLAARIHDDPAWRLAHIDGTVMVFVRRAGPNGDMPAPALPAPVSDAARRLGLKELTDTAASGFAGVRWLWSREPAAGLDFDLGSALLAIGAPAAAEAPLLSAARVSPHAFAPAFNLGVAYQQLARPAAARAAFLVALAAAPDHPDIAPLRDGLEARKAPAER